MYRHVVMAFTGPLACCFLGSWLTSLSTSPSFSHLAIICHAIGQRNFYYEPIRVTYIHRVQKGYPTVNIKVITLMPRVCVSLR